MEENGYILFKSLDLEGRGSNKIGYTMFNQVTSPELSARIDVDYKGIDSGSLVWNSGKQYELLEYLKAPAPVYPQWIRYPAKAGELVGIWKHSNRVSWPHLTEPRAWVENALRHRLCDALGAFSLFFHEELPLGFIHSHKAGHACDFRVIQKCFANGSGK